MSTLDVRPGISAVLTWHADIETAALDLAAVLSGLVGANFEIIVIVADARGEAIAADLRGRAPGLAVRVVKGECAAAAFPIASYDLIMVSARDGQFDVRELNRLMEGIERGADLAAGYRAGRANAVLRRLLRWGFPVHVEYAFQLVRREVWRRQLDRGCEPSVATARRQGYQVVEVPVSHHRPTLGPSFATQSRAA